MGSDAIPIPRFEMADRHSERAQAVGQGAAQGFVAEPVVALEVVAEAGVVEGAKGPRCGWIKVGLEAYFNPMI